MRILAIRGKNLASLKGAFEIALDKPPLEQAGLFAITGHTGAGKSTLLDAMCLALFDKIPRLIGSANVKVGRDDEDEKLRISSSDVGSIISRGTAAAYAEVDFIGVDKHHYQAHWEIKRARNKISGRLQKQSVTLTNLVSKEIIGQNKSDTLELISEKIGLTFEQFRRSVLLAQGDFAAFLKAKSDERSALLERITGTEIYSKLSVQTFRQYQEQEQQLKNIQDKIKYDVPLVFQKRQDLQIEITELNDELLNCQANIEQRQKMLKWYEQKEQLKKVQQEISRELTALNDEAQQKEVLKQRLKTIVAVQSLRPIVTAVAELSTQQEQFQSELDSAGKELELLKSDEQALAEATEKTQQNLLQTQQQFQTLKPELLKVRELDTQLRLSVKDCAEYEKNTHELQQKLTAEEHRKTDLKALQTEQKQFEQQLKELNAELEILQQQRLKYSPEVLNQQKIRLDEQHDVVQSVLQLSHNYTQHQSERLLQQTKIEQLKKQLVQWQSEQQDREAEQKVSQALLDEARRALAIMREAVAQGVQSLRGLLKADQPCPVCGSLQHPRAGQDALLNQQYQQQKQRVQVLEAQVQADSLDFTAVQQNISHTQAELCRYAEHIKHLDSDLKQFYSQWQKLVLMLETESLRQLDINDDQAVTKNINIEAERLHRAITVNKEHIASAIEVQKKIDQLQHTKDRLQDKEKHSALLISQQQLLQNSIDSLQQQLDKMLQDLQLRHEQTEQLQTERQDIVAGMLQQLTEVFSDVAQLQEADALEIFFNQQIKQLTTTYEQHKQQLDESRRKTIKLSQQCLYLQQQIAQTLQRKVQQGAQLEAQLSHYALTLEELTSLLQYDAQWLEQQQTYFSRLKDALLRAETLLQERNLQLQQHENRFADFSVELQLLNKVELAEQLAELLQSLHSRQDKLQEKQLQLKQDDEKKQRIAKVQQQLEVQQTITAQWAALNELIGSASGHKFRIFAQSLTLESLLAHANVHLNDFARRYQLQRVPDTDLDLQIIDRDMADEVRSVQSLSGGESFLVSLALALGLASLSSTRTQVESLFIDEGFGTLDQETLDIAIASLDTLQGLGRKVGIISHVPILVERIGVRVVVEKLGGGQSRVSVVG